jgi:hypothetical protein
MSAAQPAEYNYFSAGVDGPAARRRLTSMWTTLWEFTEGFFLNPWVANYVMPIFIGSWLALITANIIYIREMKTRVMTELVQLHLRLGQLAFETHRELDVKTTLLYQALLLIGEDLHRRCFFSYEAYLQKTYSDHTALVLECIRKVLTERLPQFTAAQRQAFALNPGEALLPEGFAKAVRNELAKALTSRIDNDVNRFYVIRSDLAAVLGLHSLAKLIERRHPSRAEITGPPFRISDRVSTSPMSAAPHSRGPV